jgi:hypothetical protein
MARGVNPREDDLARPGVMRRVYVEHDVALQFDLLELRLLRPDWDGPVLPAGEDVAATRHLLDVRMLGDEPVALIPETARSAGNVDPVDGLGLTKLGELRHGHTREANVRVEEVEVSREIGGWHGCALLNCNVF